MLHYTMSFDSIYFEGLARKSSNVASSSKVKKQYYTMKVLSNLDDVLGRRWYICGLNTVGDFCYVIPGSVKFHLKLRPITKCSLMAHWPSALMEGVTNLCSSLSVELGLHLSGIAFSSPVNLYSVVPTNDFCSLAIMISYFSMCTCSSGVLIELIKQYIHITEHIEKNYYQLKTSF